MFRPRNDRHVRCTGIGDSETDWFFLSCVVSGAEAAKQIRTMTQTRRCLRAGWAACCLLFLAGCGGPQTYPVRGTVTFDGKTVPTGWVTFVSDDGTSRINGAIAADGTYDLRAEPGTYLVAIGAPRQFPAGTKPEDTFRMTLPPPYVPPAFNVAERSGLKAIVEGKENKIDFPLRAASFTRRR